MSRPLLALLYLIAYFALTFGLRTWLSLRDTGDSGFRGVSGGFPSRIGGALFVLAILLALAAPVAELLGLLAPLFEPSAELVELGEGVILLGALLTFIAQLDMGAAWRIGVRRGEQTELVVSGAFRLVRNPIFSAMFVTCVGLALVTPNCLALAAGACLWLGVELQVRLVEEPHLLELHGDAYRTYAARVGRFIPGLGLFR